MPNREYADGASLFWSALLTGAAVSLACLATAAHAAPLSDQTPNTWHEFSNSRLESVAPSPLPAGRHRTVITAWSGGAYDSDRDQLIVWGGGHSDYAGNEVYAFGPLADGNPSWSRLTEPSNPPAANTPRGSDGRPVSRHTYNLLDYVPAPYNMMVSCAVGSQYSNGFSNTGVDFFNFEDLAANREPWSAGPNPPSTRYALEAFCVYNPVTNSVWFHDKGTSESRLQQYDLSTGEWTSHARLSRNTEYTAAVDITRNLLVGVGEGVIRVWDLSDPDADSVLVSSTGPKNIQNDTAEGFVFDPVNNQFVGWNGGSSVYTLSVPADYKNDEWVWSRVTLDSANSVTPTSSANNGTFGRFRYVPSAHGVVVVNSISGNVYFFKLPDNGGAPPPSVTIDADQDTIAFNTSATISWSSENATSCTASDGWSGDKPLSGSETIGPLTSDTVFRLQCTSATNASVSRAVTVSVMQATPAPTVSISANPTTVDQGGFTTISWSSTNATNCSASGAWNGAKNTSGSENVGPIQGQSDFVLTCQGPGGNDSDSVRVNVIAVADEPIVNFSANPANIDEGDSSSLVWSTVNADSCSADDGWQGSKPVSGNESTGALTTTTTFSLSCTGSGGSVSRNVTVSVTPATPGSPPSNESPDLDDDEGGGAVNLVWITALFVIFGLRRKLFVNSARERTS